MLVGLVIQNIFIWFIFFLDLEKCDNKRELRIVSLFLRKKFCIWIYMKKICLFDNFFFF